MGISKPVQPPGRYPSVPSAVPNKAILHELSLPQRRVWSPAPRSSNLPSYTPSFPAARCTSPCPSRVRIVERERGGGALTFSDGNPLAQRQVRPRDLEQRHTMLLQGWFCAGGVGRERSPACRSRATDNQRIRRFRLGVSLSLLSTGNESTR